MPPELKQREEVIRSGAAVSQPTSTRLEPELRPRYVREGQEPVSIPAPRLSSEAFRAALAELAEGSENRPAPAEDVFSREHMYMDHD